MSIPQQSRFLPEFIIRVVHTQVFVECCLLMRIVATAIAFHLRQCTFIVCIGCGIHNKGRVRKLECAEYRAFQGAWVTLPTQTCDKRPWRDRAMVFLSTKCSHFYLAVRPVNQYLLYLLFVNRSRPSLALGLLVRVQLGDPFSLPMRLFSWIRHAPLRNS